MANEYGEVPESLIKAIRHTESGNRPDLTSRKGARHEMQVMPAVAKKPGFGIRPARNDSAEEYNRIGEELISTYWDKYRGDVPLVAAAYNAGSGAVDRHGGVPPYDETLNYIRKVTERMKHEDGQDFTPEEVAQFEKRYAEEQAVNNKEFTAEEVAGFEKRYAEEQTAVEPEVPAEDQPSMLGAAWRRGVSGVKQAGQGVVTGALSALGQDELVQQRMAEQEALAKSEAEAEALHPELSSKTFQNIQDIAEKEGTWEALKQIPGYVGQKIAESAPSTATPLGVGMAVGMVNPALGVAAGITASIVQEFGFMMDRQIEKEKLAGKLEPEKAAIAAIPAGILDSIADRFTLGMKLPSFLTREVKEGAVNAVTKTFGGEVAKHVAKGVISETPTEMGQTELERWQAGEPLSGPENLAEVKEAGISAGVAGGAAGAIGGTASYLGGTPTPEATTEEPFAQPETAVGAPAPEPIAPEGVAPEVVEPTPDVTAVAPEVMGVTPTPEVTAITPTPDVTLVAPTPEVTAVAPEAIVSTPVPEVTPFVPPKFEKENISEYESKFRTLVSNLDTKYETAMQKVEDEATSQDDYEYQKDFLTRQYREDHANLLNQFKKTEQQAPRYSVENAHEYKASHRPPNMENGAPLHDVTKGGEIYPADIYSPKGLQYYGTGQDRADRESLNVIKNTKNKPDATVTMYRAVPKDSSINTINTGDWVTLSKTYAKEHGESALDNNYKIISKQVKANQLFTNGDSINEFGYWTEPTVQTTQTKSSYSAAPTEATTGHTTASLSKALSPELKRLVASGKAVIHDTQATLPGENHPANVKGMTTAEGVTHYVANKLTPSTMESVALHEVGVHAGMEKMLGKELWEDVKNQALNGQGKEFDRARAAVPASTPTHLKAEETLAYLVEHSPQLSLVRRIVAAIRNFMRSKMGANIRLSEADARQMAVASMRREATTAERTAREETAYTEKEKYERFYSALTKAIKGAPEKVFGSPNQIKLWLAGNSAKMDVKKDEIYWSGVNDWLDMQTSKVSKTDVLNYLNNGGVQVEDVMLREGEDTLTDKLFKDWLNTENAWVSYDPADDVYNAIIDGKYLGGVYNTEDEAMHRLKQEARDDVEFTASTKHGGGSLVLPDGKDYRELVVNIPTTKSYNDHDTTHFGDVGEGKQIAWLRMNTRTDGKGRDTLFLEEVQSQRSQAGRKEGFIKPLSELEKTQAKIKFNRLKKLNTELFNKLKTFADRDPEWDVVHEERKGVLNEMSKLDDIISNNYEAGVPSAPFVTDSNNKATNAYISLLLKKAISHAIDNGMDSVSWTTGDQQSDRYDLSKQIKQIITERSDNVSSGLGRVILRAYNHNDSKVIYETLDSQDQLEQYIGKELAAKAIAEMDAEDGKADLRDVDLKVGGAWTQAMYGDENGLNAQGKPSMIMQSAMEIARKMGGRIDTLTLNTGNQAALIITPEMKAKVLNEGMPLFSVGANEKDKIKYSMKQTFEDEIGSFKKQSDSASDKVFPGWLRIFSASGVYELAGEGILKGGKAVLKATRELAGLRDKMLTEMAKMRRDSFNPYIKKNHKQLGTLGDVMSESTLLGVSPRAERGKEGNIQDRIDELQETKPTGYAQLISRLQDLRQNYDKNLNTESKRVYDELAKYYENSLKEIMAAYENNIQTSGAGVDTIAKQLAKFQEQMGNLKGKGDYFPLMRFGKFGVAYKDGEVDPVTGEEIEKFTKFDTSNEAKTFLANKKINGYLVPDIQKHQEEMVGDNKTLQKLYDEIEKTFADNPAEAKEDLKDFVFQMHLMGKSNESMAKQFIHRKGTPGYSNDVFRAFDSYATNLSRQLPRIQLGRTITNGLRDIKHDLHRRIMKREFEGNVEKANSYFEAFDREITDALHPKITGPLSNFATGAAFSYYLTSPASAILQLTSVALQGIPSIGKTHGYILAHAAMGAATKMYLGSGIGRKEGWWNMERGAKLYEKEHGGYKKLVGDAKHADQTDVAKAMQSFVKEGIVTSGIHAEAFSGKGRTTGAHENIMQKAVNLMDLMSQPFAQMESASRQIVATAAYIANMKSGMTHDKAVESAIDSVYRDMGDFGSTGRSTLTKSDIARVVWQFQQYGAKLLFSMGKSAIDLATKQGHTRKEAIKHLAGLMGMHWIFAGVLGLPAAGMIGAVGDMLKDALDDDEWHNYKADLRSYLEAEGIDRAFINILLDGPLSTLTNINLSKRLGAHEILPIIHESETHDTLTTSTKENLFDMFGGAAGSLAFNISEGVGLFTKGETERAIEKLVPNAIIKNALTATRYGTEGKMNLKGEEVIPKENFSAYDLALQAMGFAPYKVFKGEESARAAKTDISFIEDKRTKLLSDFRKAREEGNTDEALDNIRKFNEKYSFTPITGKNLKQSVKTAARAKATAIFGMNFGKGEQAMKEKYAGMVDEEDFEFGTEEE